MKKLLLTLFCIVNLTIFNAQSNKEIADVYIKRSLASLENLEIEASQEHFEKAIKYTDTITSSKIAKLGTLIYFEISNYPVAKSYASQYFLLEKNKKTEEYLQLLDLYVNITEEIEKEEEEKERLELEQLKKEKELRKIDSLKIIWNRKSAALSISVDSIYTFNKNNLALFTKNNKFGIINDKGELIARATEYNDALSFDGFILLKNKKENPTKLYCYNNATGLGFFIPSFSDFNPLSTHYGQIMLPRGNGRLIMYPNNSYKPMVYDLNLKKMVNIANEINILKDLKNKDIIDKYNKEGQVKINKEWFIFGGHVGGGIYPLYVADTYQVHSYLFSIDGTILTASSNYQHIGAFHNNKLQAINAGKTIWIKQNGTKVKSPKDESGKYKGNSKVTKLENGSYQIKQEGIIILGDNKLENMGDFLRNNASE